MPIHPSYDVEKRVWFTDKGLEAETLRELQAKLPRAKIEGYYPNGYGTSLIVVPPKDAPIAPRGFTSFTSRLGVTRTLTSTARSRIRPREDRKEEADVKTVPDDSGVRDFGTAEFTAKRPKLTVDTVSEIVAPTPEEMGAPRIEETAKTPKPVDREEVWALLGGPVAPVAAPSLEEPEPVTGPTLPIPEGGYNGSRLRGARSHTFIMDDLAAVVPAPVEMERMSVTLEPVKTDPDPATFPLPIPVDVTVPSTAPAKEAPQPKRRYAPDGRAAPVVPLTAWTDERKQQLRDLFAVKRSDLEIARTMGITKNAVIGARHRLGLFRKK